MVKRTEYLPSTLLLIGTEKTQENKALATRTRTHVIFAGGEILHENNKKAFIYQTKLPLLN